MKLEEFIHKNKIYSKCTMEEKKCIDDELEKAKINERIIKGLSDDLEKSCEKNEQLTKENKQLLERIKKLEDRLL